MKRLFLSLLSLGLLLLSATSSQAITGRVQVPGGNACPSGHEIEIRMFTKSAGGWNLESVDGKPVRMISTHLGRAFDQFRASYLCRSTDPCYDIFKDLDHDGVVGSRDFGLFRQAWLASPVLDRGTWTKTTWFRRANLGQCKSITFPDMYDPAKNLFIACVDPATGIALEGKVGEDNYYWMGPPAIGTCNP